MSKGKLRLLTLHPSWKEYTKFIQGLIDKHNSVLMSSIGDTPLEQKARDDEVARRSIKNLQEILDIEKIEEGDEKKSISDRMGG